MGMHCASCAVRIERVLARRPGVRSIEVNFATQHAELTYEPGAFDLGEAGAALDKLGYQIKPVSQEAEAQADAEHGRVQRDWLRRVRLSLPLAAIVVVLVYGFPSGKIAPPPALQTSGAAGSFHPTREAGAAGEEN